MDYVVLKNELTDPRYTGLSNTEIADKLNEKIAQVPTTRMVTARAIMAELGPTMGATILEKLSAVGATIPAVKWAMIFLQQDSGIDLGHPSTQAQLDALQSAGVLTDAEVLGLKHMALRDISRCEQIFGLNTAVGAGDIELALKD